MRFQPFLSTSLFLYNLSFVVLCFQFEFLEITKICIYNLLEFLKFIKEQRRARARVEAGIRAAIGVKTRKHHSCWYPQR